MTQAKVFHLMKKLVHVFLSVWLRIINQYRKKNPTCKHMKSHKTLQTAFSISVQIYWNCTTKCRWNWKCSFSMSSSEPKFQIEECYSKNLLSENCKILGRWVLLFQKKSHKWCRGPRIIKKNNKSCTLITLPTRFSILILLYSHIVGSCSIKQGLRPRKENIA